MCRLWIIGSILGLQFLIHFGAQSLQAGIIPVANSSFESPARSDGDYTVGWDTVTNWTGSPISVAAGLRSGVENPFSSRYSQTLDVIDDPNADGHQYGYVNTYAPGSAASLTSDSVGLIEPNTRYGLTVSLGNGLDNNPMFYTIELLANSSVISVASLLGSAIASGTFTTLSTFFDSPATGAIVGQQLQIRLTGSNITAVNQGIQAHFDNVRLDASPVPSVTITVANPSFESPSRSNGGFTVGPNTVTNWTGSPSSGIAMGVENPNSSRYSQTLDVINDPNADGRQYGYVNTFGAGEVGSLTSDSVGQIAPNTRYGLTVSLGNGLDIDPSLYTIELLANSSVITTASRLGTTIPQGTFTTLSTFFDAPATGGIVGQELQIRLTGSNISGARRVIQAHFDNVVLDASPLATAVPEPGSLTLAGIGVCGLVFSGLRRQRRRTQ